MGHLLRLAGEDEADDDRGESAAEVGHLGQHLEAFLHLGIELQSVAVRVKREADGHERLQADVDRVGVRECGGVEEQAHLLSIERRLQTEQKGRDEKRLHVGGERVTAQCFTYSRRGVGVDKFGRPERIEETIGRGLAVLTVAGLGVKRHLPQDGRDANACITDGATDGVISGG